MGLAGTQQRESPGGDTWGAGHKEGQQSGEREGTATGDRGVPERQGRREASSWVREEEGERGTVRTKGHKTLLLNERTGRSPVSQSKPERRVPYAKAWFPTVETKYGNFSHSN